MNCKERRAFTYYRVHNYSGFDTLESFHEDFIGIFESYVDFYAYILNVPKTFIEPDFILNDFYELYYTYRIDDFIAVFKCR